MASASSTDIRIGDLVRVPIGKLAHSMRWVMVPPTDVCFVIGVLPGEAQHSTIVEVFWSGISAIQWADKLIKVI